MAADKVVNWELGSNARYNTGQMWQKSPGVLTDGTYEFDPDGRPLSLIPGEQDWTQGLPGARGGGGPGGGGGGGGGAFSSPYYQQYKSQLEADSTAELAAMKSQIQQIMIQAGIVPTGFTDKYGSLDDTIKGLIQQNTESGISQYARLLEGKDDTRRQTIGGLGASGLLRSGAKGYQLRRNTMDFDRTLSDMMNAVTGNVNSLRNSFAGNERQRQMSLSQFLANLMSQWRSPPSSSPPSVPPVTPPTTDPTPFTPQAPAWQAGTSQPSIKTGGGYYNIPNTTDLTSKWKRLAGIS